MSGPRLLGLSGSLRAGSYNTRLLHAAFAAFGPAEASVADLRLPLFDADLEARGTPEPVARLVDGVRAADALLVACPEYNKAPPGVLKNALDWISRAKPWPTEGKPVALMSATAGFAGGEATQFSLRLMLVAFQVRIVPGPSVHVGKAGERFDGNGQLTDADANRRVADLMARLRAML